VAGIVQRDVATKCGAIGTGALLAAVASSTLRDPCRSCFLPIQGHQTKPGLQPSDVQHALHTAGTLIRTSAFPGSSAAFFKRKCRSTVESTKVMATKSRTRAGVLSWPRLTLLQLDDAFGDRRVGLTFHDKGGSAVARHSRNAEISADPSNARNYRPRSGCAFSWRILKARTACEYPLGIRPRPWAVLGSILECGS
jgi:hypothetical protein